MCAGVVILAVVRVRAGRGTARKLPSGDTVMVVPANTDGTLQHPPPMLLLLYALVTVRCRRRVAAHPCIDCVGVLAWACCALGPCVACVSQLRA